MRARTRRWEAEEPRRCSLNSAIAEAFYEGPLTAGLWGAYALSQLFPSATKSITVRRDSDNTTADIGFVGTALDTATLATFVGANSGFVTKWWDQSGFGNDFVQATSTLQPLIVDVGTYIGELIFDGVDDQLTTTNNTAAVPAFTVYMAARDRINARGQYACVFLQGVGAQVLDDYQTISSDHYRADVLTSSGNGATFDGGDLPTRDDTAYAFVIDRSQPSTVSECLFYIAGSVPAGAASIGGQATGNFAAGVFNIGAGGGTPCRFAAKTFIIYQSAHNAGTVAYISSLIKPIPPLGGLDSFTSGLKGAWGLRKLLSAYAGNCLQVRRSSDSTTQDIGFASGFLDTASMLAFVGAGSGFVSKWYDQSGNSNDMVQATAAAQPRIINAGVVDTAVTFDGSNDALQSTNNTAAVTGLTCFVKCRANNGTNGVIVLEMGTGSGSVAEFQAIVPVGALLYTASLTNITNYVQRNYATAPAGQVIAARGDRTQATAAGQVNIFSGGAKVAQNANTGTGAVPSGNFVASKWNMGLRVTGSAFPLAGWVESAAVYEVAVSDASIERISRGMG